MIVAQSLDEVSPIQAVLRVGLSPMCFVFSWIVISGGLTFPVGARDFQEVGTVQCTV